MHIPTETFAAGANILMIWRTSCTNNADYTINLPGSGHPRVTKLKQVTLKQVILVTFRIFFRCVMAPNQTTARHCHNMKWSINFNVSNLNF